MMTFLVIAVLTAAGVAMVASCWGAQARPRRLAGAGLLAAGAVMGVLLDGDFGLLTWACMAMLAVPVCALAKAWSGKL